MKLLTSLTVTLAISFGLSAQTAFDILRFSQFDVGGTARTVGIGGGIGALGADFSVLSTNPAGLAAFRRSELTLTPTLYTSRVTSTLDGAATNLGFNEERSNFNFNNLGLVLAHRPTGSKWSTVNFGIGMNRLANFYETFSYSGTSTGSITDRFVELADGFTADELDNFEAGIAYEVGAIFNPDSDPTFYNNDFLPGEQVDKAQIVRTEGSINELLFSFAGNYEEKLMLGLTMGVPFLDFNEVKTYTETDDENRNPIFNELTFEEYLNISGTGINLKMGFIYRPIQEFRIGAAVHTPTAFNLEDNYSTEIAYDFTLGGDQYFESQSPNGLFDYKIKTPWRVIGSAAFLYQKLGFLTAEVEWVDYSSATFNFNNTTSAEDKAYERDLNNEVVDQFQPAVNIRLGGELTYDIFRFRAGYNIYNSPVKNDDVSHDAFSFGFGIRERSFFIDLAYKQTNLAETYFPYFTAAAAQPEVANEVKTQRFLATFGFKF